MRFAGKKVFVTGASRGIGNAIATMFRSEGAVVTGTRTKLGNEGNDACDEWVLADFSEIGQILSCAEFVRQAEPDILVNNAGINKIAPFAAIDPDDFQLIQQVNVFAPFLLCQSALPAMARKRWGRIVNISSIWGKISKAHRASYSSSKFALDGMTLALAAEYSAQGVLANCLAPGFIDTELTQRVLGESGIQALLPVIPALRLGQIDEIARAVLWLASEENTYLTGQNIAVDGGFTRV
jgi:3-oxoacyl-[acyl-carrier protein] reductase